MKDLSEEQVAALAGSDVRFVRRAIRSKSLPDLHPDTVKTWLEHLWDKSFRREIQGDMREEGWTPPDKKRSRGSKW